MGIPCSQKPFLRCVSLVGLCHQVCRGGSATMAWTSPLTASMRAKVASISATRSSSRFAALRIGPMPRMSRDIHACALQFEVIEREGSAVAMQEAVTRMSRVHGMSARRCLDCIGCLRLLRPSCTDLPDTAKRQCGPIKPVQDHHRTPFFVSTGFKLVPQVLNHLIGLQKT